MSTADANTLAAMGPGLLFQFDDSFRVISQAFLVDDILVVYPVDPDDQPRSWKVSKVSPGPDGGFVFDNPDVLHLEVRPLPTTIDPAIRATAVASGEQDQLLADAFVNGTEE